MHTLCPVDILPTDITNLPVPKIGTLAGLLGRKPSDRQDLSLFSLGSDSGPFSLAKLSFHCACAASEQQLHIQVGNTNHSLREKEARKIPSQDFAMQVYQGGRLVDRAQAALDVKFLGRPLLLCLGKPFIIPCN
jgi:hypothetical protein